MNTEPEEIVIELLGPLSVHLDRAPVVPSAAKPRQILALLALNAGRVVTVSTLAEEIWGDYPPRSAGTTLQTYILQLRNLIAAAAAPGRDPKQVLSTRHCGYLLASQSSQNDVHEFGRLARAGRAAAETGDFRAASELLGRALALWRGSALVDVRMGRVLELEVTALEENRLGVLERRIEADLALDRHADILGELSTLAARYPMNENFCGAPYDGALSLRPCRARAGDISAPAVGPEGRAGRGPLPAAAAAAAGRVVRRPGPGYGRIRHARRSGRAGRGRTQRRRARPGSPAAPGRDMRRRPHRGCRTGGRTGPGRRSGARQAGARPAARLMSSEPDPQCHLPHSASSSAAYPGVNSFLHARQL